MTTEPLLHPRTQLMVKNYLVQPAHGLLLAGKSGVGKLCLAQWLARKLGVEYYTVEAPEDKSGIGIEQIRELYTQTRSGSPLCVIIKNAELLSHEAQNAFLKLLEEPPQNTRFILTTQRFSQLLKTIRSRMQHITVFAPEKESLLGFIKSRSSLSDTESQALILTTEARVGLIARLLEDKEQLQQHQRAVAEAKTFYTQSPYQRHTIAASHQYDREWAHQLLSFLSVIISSLLPLATKKPPMLKKLNQQADLVQETAQNIVQINGNPKIHLARLAEKL